MKIGVDYTTQFGRFHYADSFALDTTLPLSVTVHDVFKSNALFSNFNIACSGMVPLRLQHVEIEGNHEYRVSSAVGTSQNIVGFWMMAN